MAKHAGFSYATDDGHAHEVDMDAVEAADDTTLMVSCRKCGTRGGVALLAPMLDAAAEWEEEPATEEDDEEEDEEED